MKKVEKQDTKINSLTKNKRKKVFLEAFGGVVFTLIIFLIIGWKYPDFLKINGQLSLFLWEPFFINQTCARPGGGLEFLGQFFNQFFINPLLGAALYAIGLFFLQRLILLVFHVKGKFRLLTYMPSFILFISAFSSSQRLFFEADSAYLWTLLIGWLGVFLIYYVASSLVKKSFWGVLVAFFIVSLFFIMGAFYGLVAYLGVLFTILIKRNFLALKIGLTFFVVTLLLLYFFIYPTFPFVNNFTFFSPNIFPSLSVYSPLFSWLLVLTFAGMLLAQLLPDKNNRPLFYLCSFFSFCILIGGGFVLFKTYSIEKKCRVLELAQQKKWNAIVAEDETVDLPLVCLALSQEQKLLDKLFYYYTPDKYDQKPLFEELNPQLSLVNIKILETIGLTNYAYHLMFEQMVFKAPSYYAYCLFGKSCLINDEPELAEKYYTSLSKSCYYKKEAEKYLLLCHDEQKRKLVFKKERALLPQSNYLSSVYNDMNHFFEYNYAYGQRNPYSFQYAIAGVLLKKELKRLVKWVPLFKNTKEEQLPVHVQEALLLYENLENKDNQFETLVTPIVRKNFRQFIQLSRNKKMKSLQRYKYTYWYYFMYSKK